MRFPLGVAFVVFLVTTPVRANDCTDDQLSEAAAELLLEGRDLTPDELLAAARRAGSDAPSVHALVIADGGEERIAPWLARLAARLQAPVTCGQARRDERIWVLAAPRAGTLRLDPVAGRVRIELAPGWSDPVLVVEDAEGFVARVVPYEGYAELPEELAPPFRLQLVARGPDGPRPVAERAWGTSAPPVEICGPDGPRPVPEDAVGTAGTSEPIELEPVDVSVDALRRRAGVGPLRRHRLLEAAARQHAEAVCRVGRAAHELEPGADPRARLRAHGVTARQVGEVVARGADRVAAFAALLRSPVHRSAIVDRRFTDVGIGSAFDARGRACLVVLLAAWPRLSVGER